MRLRTKYFLTAETVALVPLLAVGGFAYAYLARYLWTLAISQLHIEASAAADALALQPGRMMPIEELNDRGRKIAVLVDDAGRYLFHPDRSRIGTPASEDFPAEALGHAAAPARFSGRDAVGVVYPVLWSGGRRAWMIEQISGSALRDTLRPFRTSALLLGATAAALTTGLALLLTRALLRPIESLTRSNLAIARSGDPMDARIETAGLPNDEIGDTVRTRNLMVEALAHTQTLLAESNAELAELDRFRQEFVGTVAHEMGPPITSILAGMDVLQDRLRNVLGPGEHDILEIMKRSAVRLQIRAGDFLYLSRLEHGEVSSARSRVRVQDLLPPVLEQFRLVFQERRFKLETGIDPELPEITADAEQLDRMISNLLSNAGKYTPPGGRIGLDVKRDGERVRICVSDNGPGIPAQYREKIFERFFRIPGTTGAMGTGIGLHLVHAIATSHGGRVWMEPNDGGGSRFCVLLPLAPPP